jgi:hypothetical protein
MTKHEALASISQTVLRHRCGMVSIKEIEAIVKETSRFFSYKNNDERLKVERTAEKEVARRYGF